jgi:hypothetical protein
MLQGKGVVAKAIVGCKIWFPHGSVGSIPTTRTTCVRYVVIAEFGGIVYERDVLTLPRSRVRIPSPAPNFFKQISESERSFGVVFCFPASDAKAGEADRGETQRALGRLPQVLLLQTTFREQDPPQQTWPGSAVDVGVAHGGAPRE